MQTHVDYISISFPVSVGDVDAADTKLFFAALDMVAGGEWLRHALAQVGATFGGGRKPFAKSLGGGGITYFWHPKMQNSLLEFSGRGCQTLRDWGWERDVISKYADNLTRFDLASDIETSLSPFEFLPDSDIPKRIVSRDKITSKTGSTLYVGSFKGSEYTRVYRYNPPHHRSDLLRVETVFRHDNAKSAAHTWLVDGIAPLLERTRQRIGIQNALYRVEGDGTRATFYRHNNGNPATLLWLQTSVAAAFKRVVREGGIENPAEFLAQYFLE